LRSRSQGAALAAETRNKATVDLGDGRNCRPFEDEHFFAVFRKPPAFSQPNAVSAFE
jgi:hypothetical protein